MADDTIVMLASGDARLSANMACWETQRATEQAAARAFERVGRRVVRGSPERWSDEQPHGFIFSQAHGREVFATIDCDAPLVLVESVWQFSQHVLAGLLRHRGPVLILANWSGQWPGLVGALNLRGSLTKAGREHSLLWHETFEGEAFDRRLAAWCETSRVTHDVSHARDLQPDGLPAEAAELGRSLASLLRERPAILGVFDEGCMGMFNAIIPDHLLHPCSVFKERLSQADLWARMGRVPESEAAGVVAWLRDRGMRFEMGSADEALTEDMLLEQARMYIAAVRAADEFGLDALGIQYQLGLTGVCAASDLVEGMLNCSERPPVEATQGPRAGSVIREGEAITHFNEVDECAGLDGLLTHRVWTALGLCPDNTLHDVRWSDADRSATVEGDVWVLEISGAVPPSHFAGGYAGATGVRQPPMYFARGGSTVRGVSKPGRIVWSRVWVDGFAGPGGTLRMDIGLGRALALPEEETQRRWAQTTSQWPIMHAQLDGVSRDQLMARHQSNHIQVVYAPDDETAKRALAAKAALAEALGIGVSLCGDIGLG